MKFLHPLSLWRYEVWNYQSGLERGSLLVIQWANSKEADGIPVGLENEGNPTSVCRNSTRRLQKEEATETSYFASLPAGFWRKWN